MTFKYELQILEKHLDSFGHVNNAVYLEILEEARWDFITKNGYGLEKIKKEKKGPVVLEINMKFRKELLNRDHITIESAAIGKANKIMQIEQRIIKDNGDVAFTALLTVGFMDLQLRKLIEHPEDWKVAIGVS
jgi:acyl-CoA thioester hydrolase